MNVKVQVEAEAHLPSKGEKDKLTSQDTDTEKPKTILKYFAMCKDILWFHEREGIKDKVVTRPMALIESMRTLINHKIPKRTTGTPNSNPSSTAAPLAKNGLISYQEFLSLIQEQEGNKDFEAPELWTFLLELGLAFPLKANEPYAEINGSKLFILVPCLITDDKGEDMELKYQQMVQNSEVLSLQYKIDPGKETVGAFNVLIKAFTETFLWNGRGGKILDAYQQKIERRKFGVIGGFHGVFRWSSGGHHAL